MVPELRDPGYERLGPIGYVVKAGRRETIRRIQNLKVSMSKCQPFLSCNSGDGEGHLDRDLSSLGNNLDPRDGRFSLPRLAFHLSTQIWQILNDLDFEGGSKIDIDKKFFFLDMDWLGSKGLTENITACERALGSKAMLRNKI